MINYKKVEGTSLIIHGICNDIITETEAIAEDSHEISHKRLSEDKAEDILKSYKRIGDFIDELQKCYDFLSKELKSEMNN